ncbi:capsular polysaccharide synthesis protein [Candidatus Symbiothrix dinenymphae]|nr:capsular polysaccharide synthesis protein [Candidatus Symbiothrix dinenymphae]
MTRALRLFRLRAFIATRLTALLGRNFYQQHHETIKARMTERYFKKNYVPLLRDMTPQTPVRETPETIWQYWGQGVDNAPELVRACFATAEHYKGDRKHIIVDNKTLAQYTDLPGYVHDRFARGEIGFTPFSDLVRLNLLHNHGGYWLDATDYTTAEIPKWIDDTNFFVFHVTTGKFSYSFMQTCFIRSYKGAFLLDAWHALCMEYWRHENKVADYFHPHLMFKAMVQNDTMAKKFYEQMPLVDQAPTHTMSEPKLILTPFDADEYQRLTAGSFFQKLTYKFKGEIPKHSYAAQMIEMAK